MDSEKTLSSRMQEIRRIFEDYNFGNLGMLEQWDGEELEELSALLSEDEYQTLIDELEVWEDNQGA